MPTSHPTRVGCELKHPEGYKGVPTGTSHPTRVGCELKHYVHSGAYEYCGHPTRVGCELKRLQS